MHHKKFHLIMSVFRVMQAKKLLVLLAGSLFGIIIIYAVIQDPPLNDTDRKFRLGEIDKLIRSKASLVACKQPKLPIFSPELMKFVHQAPPIDCSSAGIDWVKCEGSECRVEEEAKLKYGKVLCSFTDVIRLNDFALTDGETTYSDTYYKLQQSDVVKVQCKTSSRKWSNTLTGIRTDKDIWDKTNWDKVPATATKYNVLMFGFDSISRNSFARKLPRSYEYLRNKLKGDVLEGYNIVGDGTPQALIPILTGQTELELPDTRKRLANTKYCNSYPFIWNDFKKAGYVTGFFEDLPDVGTFTYRLNGFNEVPTDHYMRTFYTASKADKQKWPKLCHGNVPRHKFFSVYKSKPKFLFAFHGELSHDDYNLVGVADDDLYEFLKHLKESGALDDTILILMADHGHRFAEIRNTIQGKQEERLPFFSFTFPESFKTHFKTAYENFQSNIERLTTPFDMYSTLKSVLNMDNIGVADISKRSVSLFSKIPEERSCAHAYIEPHWCACLDWEKIPLSSPIVKRVAETLVSTLNDFTQSHRNLCEILKVAEIEWITKMTPNENLLKFKKNKDLDGFVADLSDQTAVKSDLYQIKVKMVPGDSIFEASVTHFLDTDELRVKISDISRVNMYGRQARCVENDLPHLRKYCYCKD